MINFDLLNKPYDRESWKTLIKALFPSDTDLFAKPTPFNLDNERINSFVQFGNIELRDRLNATLALFEIQLQPRTTKLQINRVALRQIVDRMRQNTAITGALAVFADGETGKWRFTFIAKQEIFGEKTIETADPKRYTYVFGPGETTRTAVERLTQLASIERKKLEHVIDAFSVEKVNREFFNHYKKHYEACWQHLAKSDSIAYQTFNIDPIQADDKARKPLRDFAKRLMGRLVFIHFLQKKGWMACPIEQNDWLGGDPHFTSNLFKRLPAEEQAVFYSKYLTVLFFNTLNEKRLKDQFALPDGTLVRIPYLNGGLFDGDVPGTERFDLPAEWFEKVFEFFSQYNFTIDESAPNDQEVGIDPEMLGHIFENLLEENREKGAYYTPKEIVHYMCQESLLLYLKERLGMTPLAGDGKSSAPDFGNIVWSDSRESDEQELETFVRYKRRGDKHNFVYKNARLLEKLLLDVRICDPAIGSGAFPMGLLYEIFHCQVELDLTENWAELKKNIIHHCIYGVDKDKGAVDIARLRFWLALVVDEESPQPLPNLDYKIMQGDSLLESYEGIDLSNLLGEEEEDRRKAKTKPQLALFEVAEPIVKFGEEDKSKLATWIDQFFEPQSNAAKAELQKNINTLIEKELNDAIDRHQEELEDKLDDQKRNLAREQELKRPGTKQLKEIEKLEAEITTFQSKQAELATWQAREEKPYFLWHTWFREVFDRKGFDIVIGNPPYVQLQRLASYTDTLQNLDYETFIRTGDLYCLFYEKALISLRLGGVMAYITSNSWLKTLYGEPLRRFFSKNSTPVAILNFEDAQLFKAAIVETNILLSYKGAYNVDTLAINLDKQADTDKPLFEQLIKNGMTLQGLNEKEWIIGDAMTMRLKAKMEDGNKKLSEMEVSINFGIKTGLNEAFIIDETLKNKMIAEDSKNIEVIKPVLRGRDVQRYFYKSSNLWIIVSKYRDNEDFMITYPYVFNYLETHKEKLMKRGQVLNGQHHWAELDNNPTDKYFDKMRKEKIIWGELSNEPKFTFDGNQQYVEATLFFMEGLRLKFILSVLNSKSAEWYFNQISTTSGMGTNRWKKNKIIRLPIPTVTSRDEKLLEHLVDKILNDKKSGEDTTLPEAQIDALVFRLYGLEEIEMLTILEYLKTPQPQKNLIQSQYRDLVRNTFQLAV
jgi:TaqI-like C-terminal specificity domain/Eco57I restriction-modification methylase